MRVSTHTAARGSEDGGFLRANDGGAAVVSGGLELGVELREPLDLGRASAEVIHCGSHFEGRMEDPRVVCEDIDGWDSVSGRNTFVFAVDGYGFLLPALKFMLSVEGSSNTLPLSTLIWRGHQVR